MRKNLLISALLVLFVLAFTSVSAQDTDIKPGEETKTEPQKTYEFKQEITKNQTFERTTTYKIQVKTVSSMGKTPNETENDGGTMTQVAKYTFLEVKEGVLEKFKIEFTKMELKPIKESSANDGEEILKLKGEWVIAVRKNGKFVAEKYSEGLDKLIKAEEKEAKESKDNYGPEEGWDDDEDLYQESEPQPEDDEMDEYYAGELTSYVRQILRQPAIHNIAPKKAVAIDGTWEITPSTFGNLFDSEMYSIEENNYMLKLAKVEKVNGEEIAYISVERSFKMDEGSQKMNATSTGTILFNLTTNRISQVKIVFKMSSKYEDEDFGSFSNDISVDSTDTFKYLAAEKDEEPSQPKGEE